MNAIDDKFDDDGENDAAELIEAAEAEASRLIQDAEIEATKLVDDAEIEATKLIDDAEVEAGRLVDEAEVEADKLVEEAEKEAALLSLDIESSQKASLLIKDATKKAAVLIKQATEKAAMLIKAATQKAAILIKAKAAQKASSLIKDATKKAALLIKEAVLRVSVAKRAIQEIAERKIKFLDIAAHELRTPITALSLLLQLAERQIEKGNPISNDLLIRLRAPADRLAGLVADLIDMSRLQRGLLTLIPIETEMVTLISKCIEEFKLQAKERVFIFKKPEYRVVIHLDPLRIYQVLSNLIDNALKYTGEGAIEILLEDFPNQVRVSVKDIGQGISDNQQKALFQAFARGDSNATIHASGLGLGLSVSKAIVDLHRGRIGVDSREGCGSTFFFELPKDCL